MLRRQGGVKSTELEQLARALGRKCSPRGAEPTWVSVRPGFLPITIPHHSQGLNKFTARSILDQLEQDIDVMEANEDGRNES